MEPNPEVKRKPSEWAELQGIVIRDPDGWRFPIRGLAGGLEDEFPAQDFETPITRREFGYRAAVSTITFLKSGEQFKLGEQE